MYNNILVAILQLIVPKVKKNGQRETEIVERQRHRYIKIGLPKMPVGKVERS